MKSYSQALAAWQEVHGVDGHHIGPVLWNTLRKHLLDRPNSQTLEFGSGLSTYLFEALSGSHLALEQDENEAQHFRTAMHCEIDARNRYQYIALPDNDIVLCDGPKGAPNRIWSIRQAAAATKPDGLLFVDDVNVMQVQLELNRMRLVWQADIFGETETRQFAIVRRR